MVANEFLRQKCFPKGLIDKYKVRLIAKDFTQKQKVDYFDIFALVTRISSIYVLIALAPIYELLIHQINVKTTFLNGDLEEDTYTVQPDGYIAPGLDNKACKLRKSIYDFK